MSISTPINRRQSLSLLAGAASAMLPRRICAADTDSEQAQIAITLDLEMSRNFPRWEDTKWDYEKGNLDDATKAYTVEACRRVKQNGGVIHCFCVGQVLEHEDVTWLSNIAKDGHPIGNHTYDHVNILAEKSGAIQFKFKRAPWLISGKKPGDVIRENIQLTTKALKQRIGVDNRSFRTPGGFHNGLAEREDLQKMLLECGFRWCSAKYPQHANTKPGQQPTEDVYRSIVEAHASAQPFVYPSGLIEVPMSPISDIGAFRSGRWKLDWFLEPIRRVFAWTVEHKAVFDFLAHPSCLVAIDPKFRAIDLLCELVAESKGRARIADLDMIAATVAKFQ